VPVISWPAGSAYADLCMVQLLAELGRSWSTLLFLPLAADRRFSMRSKVSLESAAAVAISFGRRECRESSWTSPSLP